MPDSVTQFAPVLLDDAAAREMVGSYAPVSKLAEAKEELRKKALETIAKVVSDEGGEGKKVEDLYFTSFVMQ